MLPKLCFRRIDNADLIKFFNARKKDIVLRQYRSGTLKNLRSFTRDVNLEKLHTCFSKMKNNYKYPIWINAAYTTLNDRSYLLPLSSIYYLYVKDRGRVVDFLGVAFSTITSDVILCLRYRQTLKWLKYIDIFAFFHSMIGSVTSFKAKAGKTKRRKRVPSE